MSRRATRSVVAGAAATLLTLALTTTLVGCGTIPTTAAGGQREAPAPTAPADNSAPGGKQPGGSAQDPGNQPGESAPPAPQPEPVSFTSNVEDGKGGVKVNTLVNVKASNGSLSTVALTYRGVTRQGKQIKGTVKGGLSADRLSWTATERLEPSSTYTLTSTGKSVAGAAATEKSSFRTAQLTSDEETFASVTPATGQRGRASACRWCSPSTSRSKDRGAFEKNLHVQSTPAQEGSWSWLSDTEVRYPPEELVEAGHQGEGLGRHQRSRRRQRGLRSEGGRPPPSPSPEALITKINLKTHQAKVYINGKLVRTIPISAGKPGGSTRSGVKLIMDKRPMVRMTGVSIGIDRGSSEDFALNVRYAMRITASGEYLHAAPWNSGRFGNRNGSHGCVGMSTSNAIWLYNRVRQGDPVITTGSNKGIEKGNGYADWDISYAEFKKGSAI